MIRSLIQTQKKTKAIFVALFLVAIFLFVHSAYAADTNPLTNGAATAGTNSMLAAQKNGTNFSIPLLGDMFTAAINMLIYAVFVFFSWILTLATSLFAWVLNPANISGSTGVLNRQEIKDIWTNVRDFLNMFFIMILLFSAFCTIFQVDKWNLKKVWLNIVINALLVNFSFTIARFIIDISNVTMYYMLNSMFPSVTAANGGSILTKIAGDSGIQALLVPGSVAPYKTSYLIAATVFIFILAITFLVLACMFVIRLAALAIIVMFAPIGFVGYIFPSLHKYADDWWTNLFKYSFFAPIMVFMIAISIKIMGAMGSSNLTSFIQSANNQTTSSSEAKFIANLAFFVIPIIILWIGMGISQAMGVKGAGAVVGAGQKVGKWAGKKFSGYNYMKKNYDAYTKQRKAREDEKDKHRWGGKLGGGLNKLQDSAIALVTGSKGKTAGRLKAYQTSAFDAAAKASAEKIDNNEDASTIVNNVTDSAGNVNVTITNTSTKSDVMDYVGRYKQLKTDPAAKQAFESKIRTNATNINAAVSAGQTQAAASGYAVGTPEYQAILESHKSAHLDKLVTNEWTKLNTQYKNAQKHFKGETI